MAKGGKRHKEFGNPKKQQRTPRTEHFTEEDMDDEVDAFHKQRDIIALDVDDDVDASDEDNEHPVFDIEQSEDDEDDDDDDDNDAHRSTGVGVGALKRTLKFMNEKYGRVDDEEHDEEEGQEEEKIDTWGIKRSNYYAGNEVQTEEDMKAEEEEVLRLQREKAVSLTPADFGIDDDGEQDQIDSDKEPTIEDILIKGKGTSKSHVDKDTEDETRTTYEVPRDLNALSKEEQMDVVYSSAPELVGLLSELSDAVEQLEGKVNPLLDKVKGSKSSVKGGMHYLEVEKALLLAYCQSISFYLLLKSEGHPVRDHPVIARLLEIKTLLDKMKQLDGNLPLDIEEILNLNKKPESRSEILKENDAVASQPLSTHDLNSAKTDGALLARESTIELVKLDEHKIKQVKRKHQTEQVGLQSMEMLKVRASLEEKLKQKGLLSSSAPQPDKAKKHFSQPLNRQLESLGDFDDEVVDKEGVRGLSNGHARSQSNKLSQLVTSRVKKPKIVAGDDDLPPRDDIGERRRKHELRVLAKAGVDPMDDDAALATKDSRSRRYELKDSDFGDDGEAEESDEEGEPEESEDEFYKQAKEQKAAKQAAKAQIYSRTSGAPPSAETEPVDGKRQISYQIEKNRGLTRARKKDKKNPRVNNKMKHKKAVNRRKGQVRGVKTPSGPYGGEGTGININISTSRRF